MELTRMRREDEVREYIMYIHEILKSRSNIYLQVKVFKENKNTLVFKKIT